MLSPLKVTQAVILAGGRGERLRPLTDQLPKPMTPVNGSPFLEYQLNLIKKLGIRKLLLLTGYLSEKISRYFQDGVRFGISIEYSIEKEPLGTAGAIKSAQSLLDENFLLLNGDTYLLFDIQRLIKTFEGFRGAGVLAVGKSCEDNPGGNIEVDRDGFVTCYGKQLTFVNSGFALYNRRLLDYIPSGNKVSLEDEVFPVLIKNKQLKADIITKPFYDMGTFPMLAKTEEFLNGLSE